MKYLICIFKWNSEELTWELLHYTHRLDDAEKWYEYYRQNYKNVKMMVDISQIKNQEAKQNFAEFVERMKRESLRKQQEADSKSERVTQPTSDKRIVS